MIPEALFVFALVSTGLAGLAVLAAIVASRRALVVADAIDVVVQADLLFVIAYYDAALVVMLVAGRAAEHVTARWYTTLAFASPAASILASSTQLLIVATGACLGTPTWLALAAAAAPLVRNRTARHFLECP